MTSGNHMVDAPDKRGLCACGRLPTLTTWCENDNVPCDAQCPSHNAGVDCLMASERLVCKCGANVEAE